MNLKLAEAVKYKGGIVITGVKEGTIDQYIQQEMKPLDLTHIWKIIPTPDPDQSDIYIIQHNDGLLVEFFEFQKKYFGENTVWEHLKKQTWKNPTTGKTEPLKFLYCFEEDLESLNPVKEEPTPHNQIAKTPVNEEEDEEEFELDVQFKKDKEELVKAIDQKIDSLNHPHFTSQSCPISTMVQVMPKPKTLYYRKMAERFTVELASGQIIEGRGGDVLMKTQHNTLFIEPKETYDFMYEVKNNALTKKIGKEQIEYFIPAEVADYITLLEQDNEKYRIEKYLK